MIVAPTNVEVANEQPLNPLQPVEEVSDERLEDEDEPESAPSLVEPVSAELPSTPLIEQPVEQPLAQIPDEAVEAVTNTETLPAASPESEQSAVSEGTENEPESDASAVFNSLSTEEKIALLAKLQVSRLKLSLITMYVIRALLNQFLT